MRSIRELELRPMVRLRQAKDRFRSSLWFAPAISVVVAVALGFWLVAIDRRFFHGRDSGGIVFEGGAESARQLLSTIATAMLTFTVLVFSITILVLQVASNQFSPRVIRMFLQERVTKAAMATFVGTFVYAMTVLAHVREQPTEFVPQIATGAAFISVVVSVGVFVRYIHSMAHSVRAISIIAKIAAETRAGLEQMLPTASDAGPQPTAVLPARPPDAIVPHTGGPGVVTFVDEDRLVKRAQRDGAVIELVPKIGDFVPAGGELFRVWGGGEEIETCGMAVVIDIERTPPQDPSFGLRQLVDIAVRALSPGINDPSTAVQALDHLHDLVRLLTVRELPTGARFDDAGHLRLVVHQPTYEDHVRLAFDEIRHYGRGAIQVRSRLEAALLDCLSVAPVDKRDPLREQLRRVRAEDPDDARGMPDRRAHRVFRWSRTAAAAPSRRASGG